MVKDTTEYVGGKAFRRGKGTLVSDLGDGAGRCRVGGLLQHDPGGVPGASDQLSRRRADGAHADAGGVEDLRSPLVVAHAAELILRNPSRYRNQARNRPT
jgi:hypothetical protein